MVYLANIKTNHRFDLVAFLLATLCATIDWLGTDFHAWPQGTCMRSSGKICIFEGGICWPCKYLPTLEQFKKAELDVEQCAHLPQRSSCLQIERLDIVQCRSRVYGQDRRNVWTL